MGKTCSKCGEVKPLSDFHRNKKEKDEYQCQCKACRRPYDKKYNKDNKEKISAYNKQYRENNKEKLLAHNKQHKREQGKILSTTYVKNILTGTFKIKQADITPEMIELKREQLLIKRALKQAKKEGTKWEQQNT